MVYHGVKATVQCTTTLRLTAVDKKEAWQEGRSNGAPRRNDTPPRRKIAGDYCGK